MLGKIIVIVVFTLALFIDVYADNNLKIASFNVQVFGKSKIAKPMVRDNLVKIITRYDVIFIQEIRDSSGGAIKKLLDDLNSVSNEKYAIAISSRMGSTSSKEQYAYIYKKQKFKILDTFEYANKSEFERGVFAVSIKYKNTILALAGIHIDPDKVREELDNLDKALELAQRKLKTQDIVLFGDLNADCKYISPYELKYSILARNVKYKWYIDRGVDTTVSDTICAYDRIIASKTLIKNIDLAGVFYFDKEFGLSQADSLKISDHYPVEFVIEGKKEIKVVFIK